MERESPLLLSSDNITARKRQSRGGKEIWDEEIREEEIREEEIMEEEIKEEEIRDKK